MQQLETTAEAGIPPSAQFRIQLPLFEGPLDLLLHLIKKHELDVLDLPIAFVTERYLEYLRVMRELDLDIASEYLLMAATLAHIKSRMLLPKVPQDQQDAADGEEQIDPRLELMRRLLEYQKYKAAAEELGSRPVIGRDVFARGSQALEAQGPPPLAEVPILRLLDAFSAILERAQDRTAFQITAQRISLHERIVQLTELLRERRTCVFEALFSADVTRFQIVITFLALLEMTKVRILRVYQADHRSEIHVQYALLDADAPTIPPPTSDAAQQASEPALDAQSAHPANSEAISANSDEVGSVEEGVSESDGSETDDTIDEPPATDVPAANEEEA